MEDVYINYWAILVATVASFAIGALWYGPVFGKVWMRGVGLTEEDIKSANPTKAYIVNFLTGLILAFVLAHVIHQFQAFTWQKGLESGFWMWLGFAFTIKLGDAMFAGTRMSVVFIDTGYRLVWLLVSGVILAVWR